MKIIHKMRKTHIAWTHCHLKLLWLLKMILFRCHGDFWKNTEQIDTYITALQWCIISLFSIVSNCHSYNSLHNRRNVSHVDFCICYGPMHMLHGAINCCHSNRKYEPEHIIFMQLEENEITFNLNPSSFKTDNKFKCNWAFYQDW